MEPLQLWLFDHAPVTIPEIEAWTQEHAGITPDNWRYAHYVQYWDVAGKIQLAKANALLRGKGPLRKTSAHARASLDSVKKRIQKAHSMKRGI